MSFIPKVYAHEVYVLDHGEISQDLSAPRPDFLGSIAANSGQFALWGVGGVLLVGLLLFLSINKSVESFFDPLLLKFKRIAPIVAQFTIGLALLASGYYKAFLGVELPLSDTFGPHAGLVSYALIAIGLMLIFGILPRLAGIATLSALVFMTYHYGFYMINYFTYLGEALAITLFGGSYYLLSSKWVSKYFSKVIPEEWHKYKFLIIRILFGVSLIFASLYAKFIHGALALDVVNKYALTNYFPFDPVFLVLGAMIVEITLGLFFMIGFEIRFTSLFFLTFLTLSLIFFGETVWPHIVLIGTAFAMFLHGYDEFTLTYKLAKDKNLEPVL